MSTDTLLFTLMRNRLKALAEDLDFPPEVRNQTAPLLEQADLKIREARALYGRVSEIHGNNAGKRLAGPGTVS